jgi:Putative transmembrane protein (PGPGW)
MRDGDTGATMASTMANHVKRVTMAVAGGVVLLVGVALLVLPGPGLLLILAGLLILASEFPALERYVDPVRDRAMRAAEDSVSSPLRIAGSVCAGLGLIGAGVVWGVLPWLPFGGWSAGSSLILSGLILFALLIWSYRNVQAQRRAMRERATGDQAARSEGRP